MLGWIGVVGGSAVLHRPGERQWAPLPHLSERGRHLRGRDVIQRAPAVTWAPGHLGAQPRVEFPEFRLRQPPGGSWHLAINRVLAITHGSVTSVPSLTGHY